MVLELISQLLHGGHIGEENRLYDSLFDQFDLGSVKFTGKKIVFRNIEKLNSLCGVKVLLNVLLTVHLTDRGLGHHMVPVVKPIVLHIVAESSNYE